MEVPLAIGAVGAVALLALVMFAVPSVRGLGRRRKPSPTLPGWQPDQRPEAERLKPYRDELLDELKALGIQVKLNGYSAEDGSQVEVERRRPV